MPETVDTNLPARDIIRHLTHELRQPLSALESIAFYLQMTAADRPADIVAQVGRLQQMVENANWVLSDVMHMMQMAPPHAVAVDAAEVMDEVLAEGWVVEGLRVRAECAAEMSAAWVDPEQFRHLLRSLLYFLRRRTAAPGEVELFCGETEGRLRMEARAIAPGVVAADVFHPLEPNQLFTCRRIAENHGGRFTAENREGGELRLQLELPLAARG